MAFGTPTAIGTNLATTTGLQTGNITSVTAAAGDLVIVSGSVNRGGAATVSISDSASNTWTTYQDFHSGSGTHGFISWSYLANAISAGTITVAISGGINWTSATAGACKVSGAASSSTEDTAAKATVNAAASTTPTITSGTPGTAGDIFFTTYANVGATTDSYTEDTTNGTWNTLYSKSGTASSTFAMSYQINSGTGTMKHQPTTTSRGYVQCIIALKVAGGSTATGDGSSSGTSTAAATSAATAAEVGAAAGTSTVSGTGASTDNEVGNSIGTSTAAATSAATAASVGNAAGTSTAAAINGTAVIVSGDGLAEGTSTAFAISFLDGGAVARGKTGPRSGDKPFKGTYPYSTAPTPQQSWARAYWRNLKAEEDRRLQELQEAKQAVEAVRDEASAKVRQKARLESLDRVLAKIELEAEQSFVSLRKAKTNEFERAAAQALREIEALIAARQQMQEEIERKLAWLKDDDDAVTAILLTLH